MAWEKEIEEIRHKMELIDNREVKFKAERALECFNDPPRHPIVTDAISLSRKSGYSDLSLLLASLAFESNPNNAYFLVSLCTNLSYIGRSSDIIDKIEGFLRRVDVNSLSQKERDMVITSYASALKGLGNFKEGINVLENLNSDKKNPIELLSELYYRNNEPQKTIELLKNKRQLTSEMAYWMARALSLIDQTEYAIQVLQPYHDSKKIRVLLEDLQQRTGYAQEFQSRSDQVFPEDHGQEPVLGLTSSKNDDITMQVDEKDQKARLLASINKYDNNEIKKKVSLALKSLNQIPPTLSQSKIVTSIIRDIRKADYGSYQDSALELAKLAYDINQNNPFFLGELCVLLNHIGEYQIVIDKVNDFMKRVERDMFPIKAENKEYLSVNLAHAYAGLGNPKEGIRVLLELNSGAQNVMEALAELYYKAEQPSETVMLLQDQEKLSKKMAQWLVRSYIALSNREDAVRIAERFGLEDLKEEAQEHQQVGVQPNKVKSKKVWVIYGRNDKIKRGVFTFLRTIGLDPIEWEEARGLTGNSSPYIGDILKAAFDYAQAFVVLLTGDDEGRLSDKYIMQSDFEYERNLTPQARQNVIFEAGMAFGRDPSKVVFVQIGDLRPFSNISGMHILKLNNSPSARKALANRLKDANCEIIDLENKSDWLEIEDFESSED